MERVLPVWHASLSLFALFCFRVCGLNSGGWVVSALVVYLLGQEDRCHVRAAHV